MLRHIGWQQRKKKNDDEEYMKSKVDQNEKSEEDKAEVSLCEQENNVAPAEEEKNYVTSATSIAFLILIVIQTKCYSAFTRHE